MVAWNMWRKLKIPDIKLYINLIKLIKTDDLQILLCTLLHVINTIRKLIVSLIFISYHQKFNLHLFSSFKTTTQKKNMFSPHVFFRLCVEII